MATVTAAPEQKKKGATGKKIEAEGDKRFKVLEITMKRNQYHQDALIEILHKAQESFGYLDTEVLAYIAKKLKLPLSRVYGVATFYHLFSLKPSGEHTCIVCMGTACYVQGNNKILADLEEKLGIKVGGTTADGKVSLMSARCIGACGIAPSIVYDGAIAGKQDSATAISQVQTWLHR
jgi:bidirectional [NiFe] hydrogenase diaphorase subunit